MRAFLLCALLVPCASCISSSQLDPALRSVEQVREERVWRPAVQEDLDGLFRTIEVEGALGAVLREAHYWFGRDGRFSGAALIVVPAPTFQTLDGRWSLADGRLSLGAEAEPARAEVSDELLRLSGAEGVIVLERRPLP